MNYFDAEMELREHHCLGDMVAPLGGEGVDVFSDDPLNAWVHRGTTFEERNVSVLCSLLRISFVYKPLPRFSRGVA